MTDEEKLAALETTVAILTAKISAVRQEAITELGMSPLVFDALIEARMKIGEALWQSLTKEEQMEVLLAAERRATKK